MCSVDFFTTSTKWKPNKLMAKDSNPCQAVRLWNSEYACRTMPLYILLYNASRSLQCNPQEIETDSLRKTSKESPLSYRCPVNDGDQHKQWRQQLNGRHLLHCLGVTVKPATRHLTETVRRSCCCCCIRMLRVLIDPDAAEWTVFSSPTVNHYSAERNDQIMGFGAEFYVVAEQNSDDQRHEKITAVFTNEFINWHLKLNCANCVTSLVLSLCTH